MRQARLAKGLTQKQAAIRMGTINRKEISKVETGARAVNLNTIIRMCLVYEVTPNFMFGWNDD